MSLLGAAAVAVLKINYDAAFDFGRRRIGIGVVIRNGEKQNGFWKNRFRRKVVWILRTTNDFFGLINLCVESDSQILIKAINEEGLDFAPQGAVFGNIRFFYLV